MSLAQLRHLSAPHWMVNEVPNRHAASCLAICLSSSVGYAVFQAGDGLPDMKSYVIDKCPHCAGTLRQRSSEQNAALHAVLHDIRKQKQWANQWLDVETWKRLLTAAWARATGEKVSMYPALDGYGIEVLYRKTSRLSKQEMSELLEFVTAWAIEQDVRLTAPESWAERPVVA
jgi:hypothetical protein